MHSLIKSNWITLSSVVRSFDHHMVASWSESAKLYAPQSWLISMCKKKTSRQHKSKLSYFRCYFLSYKNHKLFIATEKFHYVDRKSDNTNEKTFVQKGCCSVHIEKFHYGAGHVLCSHDVLPSFWYRWEWWCSRMRPRDESSADGGVGLMVGDDQICTHSSLLFFFFIYFVHLFSSCVCVCRLLRNIHIQFLLPASYARSIHSNVWTFQCDRLLLCAQTYTQTVSTLFIRKILWHRPLSHTKRNPLCVVARYVRTRWT